MTGERLALQHNVIYCMGVVYTYEGDPGRCARSESDIARLIAISIHETGATLALRYSKDPENLPVVGERHRLYKNQYARPPTRPPHARPQIVTGRFNSSDHSLPKLALRRYDRVP